MAPELVAVADDGEGLEQSLADQIFDKFYQVRDAQGKPLRQGTGLGLSFCKMVVEAHNGRIWVESKPGEGSTFYFTLPIAPENGLLPLTATGKDTPQSQKQVGEVQAESQRVHHSQAV